MSSEEAADDDRGRGRACIASGSFVRGCRVDMVVGRNAPAAPSVRIYGRPAILVALCSPACQSQSPNHERKLCMDAPRLARRLLVASPARLETDIARIDPRRSADEAKAWTTGRHPSWGRKGNSDRAMRLSDQKRRPGLRSRALSLYAGSALISSVESTERHSSRPRPSRGGSFSAAHGLPSRILPALELQREVHGRIDEAGDRREGEGELRRRLVKLNPP